MKTPPIRIIAFSAIAALAAGQAAADVTYDGTLKYDATASVEDRYETLSQEADRHCRKVVAKQGVKPLAIKQDLQASCETQVLEKAVEAIRDDQLSAFHASETADDSQRTEMASVK